MGLLKDAFGRLFGGASTSAVETPDAGRAKSGAKGSGAKGSGLGAGGRDKKGTKPKGAEAKGTSPQKSLKAASLAPAKGKGGPESDKDGGGVPAATSAARDKALAQVRAAQGTVVTADRAELIRNAMQIRKAKQQILADLSDDQRSKLAMLAIRGLLKEGRDEPKT